MHDVTTEQATTGVEPAHDATPAPDAEQRETRERVRKGKEKAREKQREDEANSELSPEEERRKREAKSLDAKTTHTVIREQGESELERTPRALAWSGLAAGLSMGLSMVAEGALRAHLPDADWRPLVSKLGYSVGFLAVILGSQQLFTENTLTPIVPYLSKKSDVPLWKVLRLWGVVLATNILGTLLFALFAAHTELFRPEMRNAFAALGTEALAGTWGSTFVRAIGAGWVIALMVWMLPDAKYSRFLVIVVMAYVIGVANFSHIIAGSVEVLYACAIGAVPWSAYVVGFMAPTLLGNVLGGTTLVAALNHAQVAAGTE